jgi:hypothetical protein
LFRPREAGTERSARIDYQVYDDYGNLGKMTAQGDPADPLDDLQTVYSFAPPNTSAYIVDRVGLIEQGPPGGAAITKEERWYDNQGSWQNAPTKGDLTKVRRYLDPGSRWVAKSFEYTGTGMLSRITDETGRWTALEYDAAWGLFPTHVTNAVGMERDAFCRISRADDPVGGFMERAYLDRGAECLYRWICLAQHFPGLSAL